jgi:hypothetical protein
VQYNKNKSTRRLLAATTTSTTRHVGEVGEFESGEASLITQVSFFGQKIAPSDPKEIPIVLKHIYLKKGTVIPGS